MSLESWKSKGSMRRLSNEGWEGGLPLSLSDCCSPHPVWIVSLGSEALTTWKAHACHTLALTGHLSKNEQNEWEVTLVTYISKSGIPGPVDLQSQLGHSGTNKQGQAGQSSGCWKGLCPMSHRTMLRSCPSCLLQLFLFCCLLSPGQDTCRVQNWCK